LVNVIEYIYKDGEVNSDFYRCPHCTFLFARPVFIPELDSRQMDGIVNAELFGSPLLKKIYIQYFIRREIKTLRRVLGPGTVRMLDIGCGTGWTSRVYADQGFEVTGLEPSAARAAYARENYGLDIVESYIENAAFEQPFDLIVLRHIIEHFADPVAVLSQVRTFLKPEGIIFVVVPNIDCLGRYLFETRWEWVLPWHCNFFTPGSLRSMLTTNGFTPLDEYQTATSLYYPGALRRSFPFSLTDYLLKKRVLAMGLCAPLALLGAAVGLGDNLNIMARSTE